MKKDGKGNFELHLSNLKTSHSQIIIHPNEANLQLIAVHQAASPLRPTSLLIPYIPPPYAQSVDDAELLGETLADIRDAVEKVVGVKRVALDVADVAPLKASVAAVDSTGSDEGPETGSGGYP